MRVNTLPNPSEERQSRTLALVREETFLDIRSLTQRLDVSVATVRRDLDELEQAGLLRRTHGGAVSISQAGQDPRPRNPRGLPPD